MLFMIHVKQYNSSLVRTVLDSTDNSFNKNKHKELKQVRIRIEHKFNMIPFSTFILKANDEISDCFRIQKQFHKICLVAYNDFP